MPLTHFGRDPTPEPGHIVMWSGTLSNIPSGWVLCDGNNGTPNLLGKFVKQVPDGSTNPGGTGGTQSVSVSSSQMPEHNHTGSTDTDGNHGHQIDGTDNVNGLDGGTVGEWSGWNTSTTKNGSHSHSLNSTTSDTTGSGSSIDNRPSYYEVAFIMKT